MPKIGLHNRKQGCTEMARQLHRIVSPDSTSSSEKYDLANDAPPEETHIPIAATEKEPEDRFETKRFLIVRILLVTEPLK